MQHLDRRIGCFFQPILYATLDMMEKCAIYNPMIDVFAVLLKR